MKDLERFHNPVPFEDGERHTNPDPFVLRWCGRWYCYATDEAGVKVSVSEDLAHWRYKGYAIQDPSHRDYWAPSVLYRNGTFYMYYSNAPVSAGGDHEEYLNLAVSGNPEGPFRWKKTFFSEFSIDSHPLAWNGKLYLFYSMNNWIGTEDRVAGTCILLDELLTPEELAGHPRPVVLPSLKQEIYAENRFGDGRDWYTIEGAAPVAHGSRFWLFYSANAYLNEDYFIGTAVAGCKPDLMEMTWEKYPNPYTWHPLLKKSRDVEGTGHNTVTKAPNMVDDWIVYHGRRMDEIRNPEIEQREMYIDPLWFNGREALCFGPTVHEQEVPGKPQLEVREQLILEQTMFSSENPSYYAEFWISAALRHTGARYGIYLFWQDSGNYLELQIHSGRREAAMLRCSGGICRRVQRQPLEKDYDYTVPHLIRISRCFHEYCVWLDDGQPMRFTDSKAGRSGGKLGVIPYFTRLTLHSLAVTETAELREDTLRYFGEFYEGAAGGIGQDGLLRLNENAVPRSKIESAFFKEEFELEIHGAENLVAFCRGGSTVASAKNKQGVYSVYHIAQGQEERFIIDGAETPWQEIECAEKGWTLRLKNVGIAAYRFTKN